MFDLYPRHSHRTPQQIAEDTNGAFEPARPNRVDDDKNARAAARRARQLATDADQLKPDRPQPR